MNRWATLFSGTGGRCVNLRARFVGQVEKLPHNLLRLPRRETGSGPQAHGREIFAADFAMPPRSGLPMLLPSGEAIIVGHRPHVARRMLGEWILLEQRQHVR